MQCIVTRVALAAVEARTAFLAALLVQGICLPMFGGWLLVTALLSVASRARQVIG